MPERVQRKISGIDSDRSVVNDNKRPFAEGLKVGYMPVQLCKDTVAVAIFFYIV